MTKCQYYGTCGGCTLQHVPYDAQIAQKTESLRAATRFDNIKVITGNEFGYRNRMDFVFFTSGLGFRRKGKWWSIVDIEKCPISNDRLNSLLSEVRSFFARCDSFHLKEHTGTFRYAVIRTPSKSSSISFVLNADSPRKGEATDKIREFVLSTSAENVIATFVGAESDQSIGEDYMILKGTDELCETFMGKTFYYNVQGFFQNNSELAQKLQEYVHSLLKDDSGTLLDLYGGVGTFGICNSDIFSHVTIVESFPGCIESAHKNIEVNKCDNVKAVCMDAKSIQKLKIRPNVVITDPPRSGMHPKVIDWLNAVTPQKIIYISCNVQQLRKELIRLNGYTVQSAALFDFFPQTYHSEAVVELTRNE